SAGWSCYCWLLGNRKDNEFSESKISAMLEMVKNTIHDSPERTKSAMNNFLNTVAISYVPLHEKAKDVGIVEVKRDNKKSSLLNAAGSIQKEL
ncbi:DNA alkylation repair protein, partial [Bacillus sp. D-CC]